MSALLELQNLRTWFPIRRGVLGLVRGYVRAVDGVSFRIGAGESVGLVGESGCGKSTLARSVLLLERPHAGHILLEGRDIARLPPKELRALRRKVQIVFQDPFESLNPRMTVLDIVTEGPIAQGLVPAAEREAFAAQVLRDVGLGAESLHRHPHEFSGGQRQRICIARAVAMRPRLIVCDEPVSALDVSVQAQILQLLRDLQRRLGVAYLFISHDLAVVRQICDRIAVMYLGRIVEEGETDALIATPRHPYTRALLAAVPRLGSTPGERIVLSGDVPSPSRPPDGCRFNPRCPYAADVCRRKTPLLAEQPDGRRVACVRLDEIDALPPAAPHPSSNSERTDQGPDGGETARPRDERRVL